MKQVFKIIGRVALVLIGLLLPVFLLEGAVRMQNWAPPPIPNPNIWEAHPDLGWWHAPNSGGTFYSSYNEYETEVEINAQRLRDDLELTGYDLPADTFKLLILADSFGESLQVPLETTFFKQIQAGLQAQGIPAQSINGGVGNWGTDQEATFYRLAGRNYNPNLTLLFFFVRNDTNNNYAPLEIARNGGSIQKSFYQLAADGTLVYPDPFDSEHAYDNAEKPAPLPPAPLLGMADWLWLHSDLYRWLTPYLRDIPPLVKMFGPSGILGGEGRVRARHPAVPVPFYVYQTPPPDDWQQGWALTEAILADLAAQIETDGSRFALVAIPAREQVYQEEWRRTIQANTSMQAYDWNLDLPNQQLADIAARQDILLLDLLPAFRAQAGQPEHAPLYFKHDGHWTAAGHQLAAETILNFLAENNLAE